MKDPVTLLEERADESWILGWEDSLPVERLLATSARPLCEWLGQIPKDPSQSIGSQTPPRLLLATAHPIAFLLWFSSGISAGYEIFLGNPLWSDTELSRVMEQIEPALIVGPKKELPLRQIWSEIPQKFLKIPQIPKSFPQFFHSFPQAWGNSIISLEALHHEDFKRKEIAQKTDAVEKVSIFIPTGGSSGTLRFAHHGWGTLLASVQGLQASNLVTTGTIDSFCMLPMHHVSGLMQFVRSLSSGGKFAIAQFPSRRSNSEVATPAEIHQDTCSEPIPLSCFLKNSSHFQPETFFLSLVPTQLQRLLEEPANHAWLRRFRMILLGGAPAWPSLLEQAQALQLPLAPTYGMTETASQVVTLAPQDFQAGVRGCGQVLPHAQVEICGKEDEALPMGQVGVLRVRSQSLAQGYWLLSPRDSANTSAQSLSSQDGAAAATYQSFPQDERGPYLLTDDLGRFDEAGYLHIVGRSSDKIISGGENVFPVEVEAAIRATRVVADVAVCGQPDEDWGERVVAVIVPSTDSIAGAKWSGEWVGQGDKATFLKHLVESITHSLSPAKRPKDWIVVHKLPRNAQGKLNRQALRTMVQAFKPSGVRNKPPK